MKIIKIPYKRLKEINNAVELENGYTPKPFRTYKLDKNNYLQVELEEYKNITRCTKKDFLIEEDKRKFNAISLLSFINYFLILSFFVSLGMFFKDLFYFILSYYTFGNSINYINIVFYGAILYKIDLLISIICAGFLLIEKYLNFKKLKGGIENGL